MNTLGTAGVPSPQVGMASPGRPAGSDPCSRSPGPAVVGAGPDRPARISHSSTTPELSRNPRQPVRRSPVGRAEEPSRRTASFYSIFYSILSGQLPEHCQALAPRCRYLYEIRLSPPATGRGLGYRVRIAPSPTHPDGPFGPAGSLAFYSIFYSIPAPELSKTPPFYSIPGLL